MTNRLAARRVDWRAARLDAALYLIVALVSTWPLAAAIATAFPHDSSEPLFVSWSMHWVMHQLTAMLKGDGNAIAALWQAPIFFPERNALAFSEHFTAQAVQALPVWWLTGNLILAFNLVLLLAFVLTALGVSRLVQELTGSRPAGVISGVVAAVGLRLAGLPIAYMLSAPWLLFALLGVVRYVRWPSTGALALAGLSVLALNLSNQRVALYGVPGITFCAIIAMLAYRRVTDWRRWLGFAVAAVCITLVTAPFVAPYLHVRRSFSLPEAWPPMLPSTPASASDSLASPPAYLLSLSSTPGIYAVVAGLDSNAVLAELPFGDPWYELRYMFFATAHGRRLLNGHSGFSPPSYVARQRALTDPLTSPAAALDALSGATHVIVHERAWADDTGSRVVAWLESAGAQVVASDEGAALLALNPVRRNARRMGVER